VPSRQVPGVFTPEAPEFWSAQGDLEPVVANEQDIVRSTNSIIEHGVQMENFAKEFVRELVNFQWQVLGAFESDHGLNPDLSLPGLFVDIPGWIDIDFTTQPVSPLS
jgi:hypothetical protein